MTMEQNITLTGKLMEIIAFVVMMGYVFFSDLGDIKEPFDKEKKKFAFMKDYWPWRWENMGKKVFAGLAGAIVSGEVGYPILMYYLKETMVEMDFPEFSDKALHITLVAVCTYLGVKYFGKDKE